MAAKRAGKTYRAKARRPRHDWNKLVHEICALLIGLGLGLYAYESNLALVPLKWDADRRVAREISHGSAPAPVARPANQPAGQGGRSWNLVDLWDRHKQAVRQFAALPAAQRYLQHLNKYERAFEKMRIPLKGRLRQKMDELMHKGVQPVPTRWRKAENRPFVILGLVIVLSAILIKFMLHLGFWDFNRIVAKGPRRKSADWNGILNEIATFALSILSGIYLDPLLEALKHEQAIDGGEFPYPLFGSLAILMALLLKILLYTRTLDVNQWRAARRQGRKGRLLSTQRWQHFKRTYNWNHLVQGVCTAILGIFLGIYAYQSKLALLPMKWQAQQEAQRLQQQAPPPPNAAPSSQRPGIFGLLGQRVPALQSLGRGVLQQITRKLNIKGTTARKLDDLVFGKGVEAVPASFKSKANRPYVIAALIIIIVCSVLKLLIYFHWLDINQLVRKKPRDSFTGVDWNSMVTEISTIFLTVLCGIYSEPFLDNLAGRENSYPYPTVGLLVMAACVLINLLFYFGVVNLNRRRKSRVASKPSRQRRR